MSVGETYAFALRGPEDGFAIAWRLASAAGALPRWAAVWTTAALCSELSARFGGARTQVSTWAEANASVVFVSNPTIDEARDLAAHAGARPFSVHLGPVIYTLDEGPSGSWISYVDHDGFRREDARVYGIEIANNAIPLTTAHRPGCRDFDLGPQQATGWALRASVIRDHMPQEQLVLWLAEAAAVSPTSIAKVAYD